MYACSRCGEQTRRRRSFSEPMVRPKKAANASRQNGAKATNKGKAKATVPVLTYHPVGPDKYEVRAEKRAKLPKGYVAYESELVTNWLCISKGRDDERKSNVMQAFGAVLWLSRELSTSEVWQQRTVV